MTEETEEKPQEEIAASERPMEREIPPRPWEPKFLFDLQNSTEPFTPAGDWYDIRGHLVMLYALARNINGGDPSWPKPMRPPTRLEIGTREGASTLALLQAARETGGKLISIECGEWEARVTRYVVEQHSLDLWWHQIIGRSEEVTEQCPDELDMVMIDGDHGDKQCKLDTANYAPKVRVGGLLLFHDYWSNAECIGTPVKEPYPSYASNSVEALRHSGRWEVLVLPWSFGLAICRKVY